MGVLVGCSPVSDMCPHSNVEEWLAPAHRPQGSLMVRKTSDEGARTLKQSLRSSTGYCSPELSIHEDVGAMVPSGLGEGMDWLLSGQCRRLWQMGYAPEYLHAIFGSLPLDLMTPLADSSKQLDMEEIGHLQYIRQSRAKFNLDAIDLLLGCTSPTSPHEEQLACGQCEFNVWEGAEHGVLCYMWDRMSNERLGCYANASLAKLCGVSTDELLHRIATNSLPPTCPQIDHLCFMLEGMSSPSSTLMSRRYARWLWPGGEPKLMEFVDRKLFDPLGRTAVCVTFVRELSAEEWDKAAHEQQSPLRRLAAALGDVRSGKELVADLEEDMRLPLAAHPALHALAALAANLNLPRDLHVRRQPPSGSVQRGSQQLRTRTAHVLQAAAD